MLPGDARASNVSLSPSHLPPIAALLNWQRVNTESERSVCSHRLSLRSAEAKVARVKDEAETMAPSSRARTKVTSAPSAFCRSAFLRFASLKSAPASRTFPSLHDVIVARANEAPTSSEAWNCAYGRCSFLKSRLYYYY